MPARRAIWTDRCLARVSPPDTLRGKLIQTVSENLAADISTTVVAPAYSTLLSASMTTTLATAELDILFYCSFDHTDVANDAVSFRLRLDGVLIPPSRAADDNNTGNNNMSVAINRRVNVAPGLHTLDVEWSKFSVSTLQCFPATRPDQHGAHLKLEERRL